MIHTAEKKLLALIKAKEEFEPYRSQFQEDPVKFTGADENGKCSDETCDCHTEPKSGGLVSRAGIALDT